VQREAFLHAAAKCGSSVAEIADATGVPEETAKEPSPLRGSRKLRAQLKDLL
jgi:DNA-directed RNA polymerase specialized sigma24 family protein